MTKYLVNIHFPVFLFFWGVFLYKYTEKKNPVKVWEHNIYNAIYRFVAF